MEQSEGDGNYACALRHLAPNGGEITTGAARRTARVTGILFLPSRPNFNSTKIADVCVCDARRRKSTMKPLQFLLPQWIPVLVLRASSNEPPGQRGCSRIPTSSWNCQVLQ
ncbi:Hypothetical protein NTJ_06786 [Nesidiocoris tenuis]|uniref:Ig-like domain-containing protein n=1 Tax=Nesidiocoris tenuis TaxID=355587 RepID=A0ABN7ASV1_9HEMI|nr:Hypothetical protein NTJ_06786 [Nesidiocoris tenuis]